MSSNYPGGFATGVTIRGTPIDVPNPGEVFWVNNSGVLAKGGVGGSDGNDGSYRRPFLTLDYAIGRCTAGRGDVIYLMPGHSEAVATANAVDFDVAGVTCIGLGYGASQAQIRLTAAAASVTVGAVDTTWVNLRVTAAFADVAAAVDLNVDGFSAINCLFDEEVADENFIIVFDAITGVDNISIIGCEAYFQDVKAEEFLQLQGSHNKVRIIDNNFQRDVLQTSVKAFITSATAVTRGTITGNTFVTTEDAAAASCVVLTGTINDGVCDDNLIGFLDTNATNANCISALDVTGMTMGRNEASGAVDECSNIFSRSSLTS